MNHKAFASKEASKTRARCGFGLTHRKIFLLRGRPSIKTFLVRFDMPTKRRRTGPTVPVAGLPAGNNPHQAALDEVAKMFQEAEVRHAADIKQVAADTAKAAAATFAEQLKIILPPPALPTDDDVEEDETADERAGGGGTHAGRCRCPGGRGPHGGAEER